MHNFLVLTGFSQSRHLRFLIVKHKKINQCLVKLSTGTEWLFSMIINSLWTSSLQPTVLYKDKKNSVMVTMWRIKFKDIQKSGNMRARTKLTATATSYSIFYSHLYWRMITFSETFKQVQGCCVFNFWRWRLQNVKY